MRLASSRRLSTCPCASSPRAHLRPCRHPRRRFAKLRRALRACCSLRSRKRHGRRLSTPTSGSDRRRCCGSTALATAATRKTSCGASANTCAPMNAVKSGCPPSCTARRWRARVSSPGSSSTRRAPGNASRSSSIGNARSPCKSSTWAASPSPECPCASRRAIRTRRSTRVTRSGRARRAVRKGSPSCINSMKHASGAVRAERSSTTRSASGSSRRCPFRSPHRSRLVSTPTSCPPNPCGSCCRRPVRCGSRSCNPMGLRTRAATGSTRSSPPCRPGRPGTVWRVGSCAAVLSTFHTSVSGSSCGSKRSRRVSDRPLSSSRDRPSPVKACTLSSSSGRPCSSSAAARWIRTERRSRIARSPFSSMSSTAHSAGCI